MQSVSVPALNIGFACFVIQITFINRRVDLEGYFRSGKCNGQKTDNLRVLPNGTRIYDITLAEKYANWLLLGEQQS